MYTLIGKIKGSMKNTRLHILFLISLLSLLSCQGEDKPLEISLPPTPVLSVQSTWAVVKASHVRLREKPDVESKALATLWRGSVLEIISREARKVVLEEEENYWYRINYDGLSGWVFGFNLDFYDSRSTAERVSREMK